MDYKIKKKKELEKQGILDTSTWDQELEKYIENKYGVWLSQLFRSGYTYTFNKKNPLGIIIYVFLMGFCFIYVYFYEVDRHIPARFLDYKNKYLLLIIVVFAWIIYLNILFKEPLSLKQKLK
jgi:hypothetical protein